MVHFPLFFFLLHDKLLCSMLAECENYMFGFTTTLKFSGSVVTDSKNFFFFFFVAELYALLDDNVGKL